MVLDALNFNPKVHDRKPFEAGRVAFAGGDHETQRSTGVETYGTGQGINGINSTGVHNSVTGTGEDGKHKLNMYF